MIALRIVSYAYILIILAISIILAVTLMKRMYFFLHMMQLEGYKNNCFIPWIIKFKNKAFPLLFVGFIAIPLISFFASRLLNSIVLRSVFIVLNIILSAGALLQLNKESKRESKKKFIWTRRSIRLAIAGGTVMVIFAFWLFKIFYGELFSAYSSVSFPASFFSLSFHMTAIETFGILLFFQPFFIIGGNIVVYPVERYFYIYYKNKARNKLKHFKNCKIIGITGSYGKTSTKMIVGTLLSEKYCVLATPESYNTPMGVCKVINNTLNDAHEIFIVEMGARRKGDIKELGQLTMPSIGILTSIGPAHMETFKSIEGVIDAKFELIDGLPSNGLAVLNADNSYIMENIDRVKCQYILYGMENKHAEIRASDVVLFERGSKFLLYCKNESVKCETKLLGKHNIVNILAGCAAAYSLGFTLEQISKAIQSLEPVPHRLALMTPPSGVVIIDDAFNANPDSAAAACEVLSGFKSPSRVIITPGFVEQGKNEDVAHFEFGKKIAQCSTHAILVGVKRTEKIKNGLISMSFPLDCVFSVQSLDEATSILQTFIKPGDVVLFENDLPDNYSE